MKFRTHRRVFIEDPKKVRASIFSSSVLNSYNFLGSFCFYLWLGAETG
jgi:hypothetical protein